MRPSIIGFSLVAVFTQLALASPEPKPFPAPKPYAMPYAMPKALAQSGECPGTDTVCYDTCIPATDACCSGGGGCPNGMEAIIPTANID
jgi:hypothetical protein